MPDPSHERTHRLIDKRVPLHLLPTEEDLQRVDQMNPCECPRRYCWHWKTLSLDWDTPISEGCDAHFRGVNYRGEPIPAMHDTPCKRLDPSNPKDHFEPNEPAMLEDGIPEGRWDCGDKKQFKTSGFSSRNLNSVTLDGKQFCVTNRSEFATFLEAFRVYIEDSNADIENPTLDRFLEALQAWTNDADASSVFAPSTLSQNMNLNPWSTLAMMLIAASMYE